ncbi:hypothetical protein X742_04710 [Mesorhizobium sp. LNHC232B00]|nr:hypothetical protein X742_04710 [Mesorhizobium sp. LNHC232B00]
MLVQGWSSPGSRGSIAGRIDPAFAGEIGRLWRFDRSAFLRRRHKGAVALYADALRARLAWTRISAG